MRRGEVYWAERQPRSGSEQQGRRPVIILSHDGFNEAPGWKSVIVVPCSTAEAQKRRGPTVVALAAGTDGLPQDCVALCHQVTTLDRSKLTRRLGVLPELALRGVEVALKEAVDLD